VLQVHNRYRSTSPSGEDRVVDQEGSALEAAGHTVERFERFSDDIARSSAVRRAAVPFQVVWSDQARRSLAATLRRRRPDVVHVHNTFPLLSPSVLYACRSERVPVVATMHHYGLVCASGVLFRDGAVCHDCVGRLPLPAIRHGCYRDSSLASLPVAAALVAHRRAWRTMVSAYVFLSEAQRTTIASDGLPLSRSFVKPNFVHASGLPTAPKEDVVVYAGRLAATKGLPLLMEAWDRYSANGHRRLRLLIAGSGPMEASVATWAAARPSVEWLGLVGPSACASLLARARAAIVPSAWEETFGLVAAEAMAAGVPPIAADHGSFPELIDHGVDGILFDRSSAAALAGVLADIDARPARYEELGRAAHATYLRRFSVEANLAQLLDIYTFAIENPAA
jgi:glycosyltransferase involved in cell wall biosynthesis